MANDRTNLWTEHAATLREAYCRSVGTIGFEVVTRYLLSHLPAEPQRIVDIGGGFGRQAIMLARAGHSVTILDSDRSMLALAADAVSKESQDVASRITIVFGNGEDVTSTVGANFGLVCCHSVLMYLSDPTPMLRALVSAVRSGGLVSVLSVNPDAIAMRSGLQGRWKEAAASIEGRVQTGTQYLPTYSYSKERVSSALESTGFKVRGWQGVGIFTDHVAGTIVAEDPADVYYAEWLASTRDPYRQVARCFHVLAERN